MNIKYIWLLTEFNIIASHRDESLLRPTLYNDPVFLSFLKKYSNDIEATGVLNIPAKTTEIHAACNTLRTLLFEYEREQLVTQELCKIRLIARQLQAAVPFFIFTIERKEQKNEFTCVLDATRCNLVFTDLLGHAPFNFVSGNINATDLYAIERTASLLHFMRSVTTN